MITYNRNYDLILSRLKLANCNPSTHKAASIPRRVANVLFSSSSNVLFIRASRYDSIEGSFTRNRIDVSEDCRVAGCATDEIRMVTVSLMYPSSSRLCRPLYTFKYSIDSKSALATLGIASNSIFGSPPPSPRSNGRDAKTSNAVSFVINIKF